MIENVGPLEQYQVEGGAPLANSRKAPNSVNGAGIIIGGIIALLVTFWLD